jgi:hypothetical protein
MKKDILLKIAKDAILSEFDNRKIDRENLIREYPTPKEGGCICNNKRERRIKRLYWFVSST